MSAAALAVLVLLVVSAVWLARHPRPMRAAARRVAGAGPLQQGLAQARRSGWWHLLAQRLPAGEATALALAAGLAAVFALAVLFAYLLDSVLDGEGIAEVDRPVSGWLAGHRDGWLTAVLRVVTDAGSPAAVAMLAAVVCAAVAWRRRSWLPVAVGVAGAGGIGLVVTGAKLLVGRARPPLPFAAIAEDGYSFPSGHAAGTAAVAVLSAWVLTCWAARSWNARVAIWAFAALLIGAVGFSRIYLGVHYVSDVAAGWALGAVWAGTVIMAGSWWKHASSARETARQEGGSDLRPDRRPAVAAHSGADRGRAGQGTAG